MAGIILRLNALVKADTRAEHVTALTDFPGAFDKQGHLRYNEPLLLPEIGLGAAYVCHLSPAQVRHAAARLLLSLARLQGGL